MLARLTGTLEALDGNAALVAPGETGFRSGLGYEVLLPAYLAQRILAEGRIGALETFHTLEYLEAQGQGTSFIPRLIGFESAKEREFFDLLTSVKGLGNKRALRAMAIEPGSIARMIAERDTRSLQRLPEIGPKLAESLVHELKSKVDAYVNLSGSSAKGGGHSPTPAAPAASVAKVKTAPARSKPGTNGRKADAPMPPIRQAVDALVALGEQPGDAERMVAKAIDRARAAGQEPPLVPAELITAAYGSR